MLGREGKGPHYCSRQEPGTWFFPCCPYLLPGAPFLAIPNSVGEDRASSFEPQGRVYVFLDLSL